MNLSVPRLHRVPSELGESGLVLGRAHTPVFGDSERVGYLYSALKSVNAPEHGSVFSRP